MKKTLLSLHIVAVLPSLTHACAVCFGGADSGWTRGFTWGVAFLGILPFALMGGLIGLVARATKKHHGTPR